MEKIPVEKIQDGMKLARPIMGPAGNILIAKGVSLKSSLISRFQSWKIAEIFVESIEQESKQEEKPKNEPQIDLTHLFRKRLDNPTMKIIHNSLVAHLNKAN